ncbi:hypothetical protein KKA53_03425 [Candidatus Dependentiae bacterium]|nr:hypothetical protein [Candidatus Dependentiae bacterium]
MCAKKKENVKKLEEKGLKNSKAIEKNDYSDFKNLCNELKNTEKDILNEIDKLGYGSLTIEEFAVHSADGLRGQLAMSEFLSLQKRCEDLLIDRENLKNVVVVEPSKLPEIIDIVEGILANNDERPVFQMSGRLVYLVKIACIPARKKDGVKRPCDLMVIKAVDQAFLTVFLTKIAKFVKKDGRSNKYYLIDCPERIARYLIAKGEWDISVLTGIINGPTLRSDGSILDKPDYDKESGLFFVPDLNTFEKIPENPTKEDAEKSLDRLLFLIKDFPFDGDASKSVAIVAILTALIRKSISAAPLIGFTAPKMANGKTLLANVVSYIATGKSNSVMAQAENEAEEKKRLLAVLMEGDSVICYDNIEKPFGSAALCAVLTQPEYKDRILGSSETKTVLTNATFLVTGNNLTFVGDISTRALLCKLDSKVESPEKRTFDVDIIKYIQENRGTLVRDGLTILRAYHVADYPKQALEPFGRFEKWGRWVRSSVVWLGMADPCKSRESIEDADPIRCALGALYSCWHQIFSDRAVRANEIIDASINHKEIEGREGLLEAIQELVSGGKGTVNVRSLGKVLSRHRDRIESGFCLEKMPKYQGTTRWRVRKVVEEKG